MITEPEQLNRLSMKEFPGLFASLEPPHRDVLRGHFRGSIVGPTWNRRLSGPLLAVTGLGGWCGKEFDAQGNAINLVRRRGEVKRIFPMLLVEQVSLLDGKPGLALQYAPTNPFPWPRVLDELRSLSPGLVLGISIICIGPLQRMPMPFVLQSTEQVDGL